MTVAPTRWHVDIEKRLGSEFWSNRYIVQSPDSTSPMDFANELVEAERIIHNAAVFFTRVRVSSADPEDERYTIVPLNVSGTRVNSGTLLPLFNTLRVDFPASSGRPSRKYYRGVLGEDDISGDLVTSDFTVFGAALTLLTGPSTEARIVDPQGQSLITALLHPFVQMRQLRRSRRRRTNGGGIFQ